MSDIVERLRQYVEFGGKVYVYRATLRTLREHLRAADHADGAP